VPVLHRQRAAVSPASELPRSPADSTMAMNAVMARAKTRALRRGGAQIRCRPFAVIIELKAP
jgi:hypothetical protein